MPWSMSRHNVAKGWGGGGGGESNCLDTEDDGSKKLQYFKPGINSGDYFMHPIIEKSLRKECFEF